MSLFASSVNSAPAANEGFTFGPSAKSGFGAPVTDVFGLGSASSVGFGITSSGSNAVGEIVWSDSASDPFGRVESTNHCFARNGKVPAASKWTPPKPPSRPLFQSPPGSHSSSRDTVPLFGPPAQSTTLFGTSGLNSGGSEATTRGGGFTFGYVAPTTNTDTGFGSVGTFFGRGNTTLFGSTAGSNVDLGARTVFGSPGSSLEASRVGSSFEGNCTVFGAGSSAAKPPLIPSVNPFTTSTKQVGNSSSNPFAPKSALTSNAFTRTTPRSTGNPFAMKMSANASVNPFAVKIPSVESVSVPDAAKSLSSVPGRTESMKFKSGLHPAFNTGFQQQQNQTLAPTQSASVAGFDWTNWKKGRESSTGSLFTMPSFSISDAKSSSLGDSSSMSSPPDALVASPDTDPYGSGSFGAGLVEQTIKKAIANPPSSVELKVLDAGNCTKPRQQPSARFAARLGLARQPLQTLPVRSMQPRFPIRKLHTVPSSSRAKLPQADVFQFSSSFSRLAISKKQLRVRVDPSATTEKSKKSEPIDEITDTQTAVAKSSAEHDGEDNSDSPPPVYPILLNKEYFTKPSASELQQLTEEKLSSVENFVIGRQHCGKITFVDAVDVRGLLLDELVTFSMGEVVVYPDDNAKPAIGSGFNKPAIVELDGISAEENEPREDFLKRLESHTQAMGATFVGYDDSNTRDGGVWSFRVEHF